MHLICSLHRERKECVAHRRFHAASPSAACNGALTEDFHTVVFHAGIGLHILVFKFHAHKQAPLLVEKLSEVRLHREAHRRFVALDFADFNRQRNRRCAAEIVAGTQFDVPTFQCCVDDFLRAALLSRQLRGQKCQRHDNCG